jgi:iron(II)-dependent oxidoreductase
VLIPEARYTIGNNSGPLDARPAHGVSLAAFRIGAREVTNGEYAAAARTAGKPMAVPLRPEDSALPVTGIAWSDASSYCAAHFKNGRLPSEEEWEAAARGRAGRSTPWDNATPGVHANLASAGLVGPAPVGSYATGATPEGVYDLLGNVWEWTSSAYRAYPGGSVKTPPAGTYYVIRGGAFNTPDAVATPWYRMFANASGSADDLSRTGFRCAAPAESSK